MGLTWHRVLGLRVFVLRARTFFSLEVNQRRWGDFALESNEAREAHAQEPDLRVSWTFHKLNDYIRAVDVVY